MIRLILALAVGVLIGTTCVRLVVEVSEFTEHIQTKFIKPTMIHGDH